MTKRAGRRKHRMGSQRQPPSAKPTPREPTIVRDNLPPAESLSLELQAISKGWINEDAKFDQLRTALINKVVKAGIESPDPHLTIKALRAVAQTEQRTKQLQLAAIALQRRGIGSDLPEQIQVSAVPEAPKAIQSNPYEVIQELIKRNDVRAALHHGPANTAQPS